jgi:hypothetical protein
MLIDTMKPNQATVKEEYINRDNITNTKNFLFQPHGDSGKCCYIKKNSNDERERTHVLLDGGNIHIPKSMMSTFEANYATDIVAGNKNYVVELRTPVFKYYIDVDIFDHEFYDGPKLRKIVDRIQKALSNFFKYDVYVCTSPPKDVVKDKQHYIKTGVHLIWPDVFVTQEIALFLRQFIIQYLRKKFGPRSETNSWEDVIDETVYIKNGLRMIGSYKASICKLCKNKETLRESCDACFGQGRLFGKHKYSLEYIRSTEKTMKTKKFVEITKKQSALTSLLSVRSNKYKSNIVLREPYPSWFNIHAASRANRHVGDILKQTREQCKRTGGRHAVNIDDPEIVSSVEALIQSTFGQSHSFDNIGVMTVRKPTNTKVPCYWVTTDCNYCLNVGREHGSSTIYFKITYNAITQKCFCKKANTHHSATGVVCSNFESSKEGLTFRYKEKLFPDEYAKQSINDPMIYATKPPETNDEPVELSGNLLDDLDFLI